ncbi:unnamed protein product [Urochloa humidicola]
MLERRTIREPSEAFYPPHLWRDVEPVVQERALAAGVGDAAGGQQQEEDGSRRRTRSPPREQGRAPPGRTRDASGGPVPRSGRRHRARREAEVMQVLTKKFDEMGECSAACGAMLGGARPDEEATLRRYGRTIGVLYKLASRNGLPRPRRGSRAVAHPGGAGPLADPPVAARGSSKPAACG